jgi:hypothetical protein
MAEKGMAGTVGIRAATKPTFSYKTTKVLLSGGAGEISPTGGEVVMDAPDADYLEIMATVEGSMAVAGGIEIQPFLALTKVLDKSVSVDFGVPVYNLLVIAASLAIAVGLGESTIASLSGYETLQVQSVLIGKSDGPTSVAASLATLLFGFVLLLILSLVTRGRRGGKTPGVTT